VTVAGGSVKIDDAKVTATDIAASNGRRSGWWRLPKDCWDSDQLTVVRLPPSPVAPRRHPRDRHGHPAPLGQVESSAKLEASSACGAKPSPRITDSRDRRSRRGSGDAVSLSSSRSD
jgi:hypothetical protein